MRPRRQPVSSARARRCRVDAGGSSRYASLNVLLAPMVARVLSYSRCAAVKRRRRIDCYHGRRCGSPCSPTDVPDKSCGRSC